MTALSPGGELITATTLGAWPVWIVEVTQATSRTWASLDYGGFEGRVASIGSIVRQARQTSRGALDVALVNTPDPSTGVRPSDLYGPSEPLEGARVKVSVVAGSTRVLFHGVVEEVLEESGHTLSFRCRSGKAWTIADLLDPILASEAGPGERIPPTSLKLAKPFALGLVEGCRPVPYKVPAHTGLTSTLTSTATEAFVDTTEGFVGAGSLDIDGEVMTYAGTTGTSFTGLVRPSPASHAPGARVGQVGPLVFLVASHALHGVSAVSNVRLLDEGGALRPVPGDVTVTVDPAGPATIELDAQPVLLSGAATPNALKFLDLDTVAHSDLAAGEAAKCLGLADEYLETNSAVLTGTLGTGGQRVATIALPEESTLARAWAVVEAFGAAELLTELTAPAGAGDTALSADTTGWPTSGRIYLESGSQASELVTYAGTTGSSFTGVVRNLNGNGGAHPAGARVSLGSGEVFLDLGGADPDDADAVGALQDKPLPPEEAACELVPAVHGFEASHTHTVPEHDHNAWDTEHGHETDTNVLVVRGLGVAVKLGIGGGTGSPVSMGIFLASTVALMLDGVGTTAHDITHTNIGGPYPGGYDRTNWWAHIFPFGSFEGDTRKVKAVDAFVTFSATGAGGIQQVANGVPVGPSNPGVVPGVGLASYPVVPPEATGNPANLAASGLFGQWKNETAMTPSSPPDGGSLVLVKTGSVDPFEVWGDDDTTDQSSRPMELSGYLAIETGGQTEWIRYASARWLDTAAGRWQLEGITRGAFSSPKLTIPANSSDIINKFPARGYHVLSIDRVGVGEGLEVPHLSGTKLATMASNPGTLYTLQTRVAETLEDIENSMDPAAFEFTLADLFRKDALHPDDGSALPFDDGTNIYEQFGSAPRIAALAPILWILAHTNLNVHDAWLEVRLQELTTDDALPGEPEPEGTTSETTEPLGVSELTWFDITHLVASLGELEGATLKVVRNDTIPGARSELRLLRLFFVGELTGLTSTSRFYPDVLVADVEGAGITTPGGVARGAEVVRQALLTGLELPAGDVDSASFAAADPSTAVAGRFLHSQESALEALEALAAEYRLTLRTDTAGKLSVAYRPDRASLPAPVATFTADDVLQGGIAEGVGVRVSRILLKDVISTATVRARAVPYLDDAPSLTATATAPSSPVVRPVEADLLGVLTQAGADDFAGHLVDYHGVPLNRITWRTFTQGLDVLEGDVVELDHPEYASAGLLVERVVIDPSKRDGGLVTIEAIDLSP